MGFSKTCIPSVSQTDGEKLTGRCDDEHDDDRGQKKEVSILKPGGRGANLFFLTTSGSKSTVRYVKKIIADYQQLIEYNQVIITQHGYINNHVTYFC